jgi:hypothetical protein
MRKEDVRAALKRDPFEPVRLHLTDGRTYDVPFREVAHMLGYGVLVLIGLKQGTRVAEGYDRFAFDDIEKIEPLSAGGGKGRKRKAS